MRCSNCKFYGQDTSRPEYGACYVKRHKSADSGQFNYAMVRGNNSRCYYYQRKEDDVPVS